MFELCKGIYAEKLGAGYFRVYTGDEQVQVFVRITTFMVSKVTARLLRNIARQLGDFQRKQE